MKRSPIDAALACVLWLPPLSKHGLLVARFLQFAKAAENQVGATQRDRESAGQTLKVEPDFAIETDTPDVQAEASSTSVGRDKSEVSHHPLERVERVRY